MSLKKNIDLSTFVKVITAEVVDEAAKFAKRDAVRFVANPDNPRFEFSKGDLRDSIRVEKMGGLVKLISDTPYSLAQEYGRPDLPRYRFTPFFRPAAINVAATRTMTAITAIATRKALKASKR